MVVQRAQAEEVARQQQTAGVRIPEREGEIADQPVERLLAPAFEAGEQDRRIAHHRGPVGSKAKGGRQIVPIVQSDVRHQRQAPVRAVQRLAVIGVFRDGAEQPPPHRNRAVGPLPDVMWPVHLLRREHPLAG